MTTGRRRASFELATAAACLGVVAAVSLVGMRARWGGALPRAELVGVRAAVRARQIRAAAAGFARGVQSRHEELYLAHVRKWLDSDGEDAAQGHPARNFTPCDSWRGCTERRDQYEVETLWDNNGSVAMNGTTEILPRQVQFECGGEASTDVCFRATMQCLDSAESFAEQLYKVSPYEGSEMRTKSTCKCFSSNGCSPSCNVVLYQRWSANTGINCPARPPIFHKESGVYQYGDPDASFVAPNSYSFDYYPEFPNPAGHVYNAAWARDTFEAEPAIGVYQSPVTASYDEADDGVRVSLSLSLSGFLISACLACHVLPPTDLTPLRWLLARSGRSNAIAPFGDWLTPALLLGQSCQD